MKNKIFTLTALSVSMMSGFANANANDTAAVGDKEYTFTVSGTIAPSLAVLTDGDGNIMNQPAINANYDMSALQADPSADMSVTLLERAKISAGAGETSFDLTFKAKSFTFDGTSCRDIDHNAASTGGQIGYVCGKDHWMSVPGETDKAFNALKVVQGSAVYTTSLDPDVEFGGFTIKHTKGATGPWKTGTYESVWDLTITPKF
ncbi:MULTISPECIES: hypothetical protein [unclassified Vibrio]|uniref:hypothetical protein n=1 Tax=unclassified Vibrio TaxID=2614977 RepID=UPI000B8EB8FD|nr:MULTISPECIES: hypothetical protein [unclassified Vibrio]OXX34124.1 hypothetical protein B9J81_09555 [Vibrio sp. V04_P4A5T148]OXX36604.1 hypothetical protein B9J95_00015 [Vibrio sp. V14_P6S14T42]